MSFAFLQLLEFILVLVASLAMIQTISIALRLSYGRDCSKEEMLSKQKHCLTHIKPDVSELKVPQTAFVCDADQGGHRHTQMQTTENRTEAFTRKTRCFEKKAQSTTSSAEPGCRRAFCGPLLC